MLQKDGNRSTVTSRSTWLSLSSKTTTSLHYVNYSNMTLHGRKVGFYRHDSIQIWVVEKNLIDYIANSPEQESKKYFPIWTASDVKAIQWTSDVSIVYYLVCSQQHTATLKSSPWQEVKTAIGSNTKAFLYTLSPKITTCCDNCVQRKDDPEWFGAWLPLRLHTLLLLRRCEDCRWQM